jgi:colicin import membrane protein
MFNWFKRKNAQGVVDAEKGTTKFNSEDVFVDVDGVKINAKELEEAQIAVEAEEAEEKKKKELEKENGHEPISMDEKVTLSNGKEYNVGDLVANFKARQAKKNASEGENKKKKEEEAKVAEEKMNSLKLRANAAGLKDDASEEEIVKAETEKKNAADAEAKEKEDKEVKDKEEAVKKENARKLGDKSFNELHNARNTFAPEGARAPVGAKSREERAKEWKAKNSNKEK